MRTDFDLPPPTINAKTARARAVWLAPWHKQMINDIRRELARQTPPRHMSLYFFRQLVQYADRAYELAEVSQLRLDI